MALYMKYPSWMQPYVIPGLPVRWYAVMYIVAFAFAYVFFRLQCRRDGVIKYSASESQNLFFWGILGLLLGARIGSCLLYSDWRYYITHPWMMFWPFENGHFVGLPGMSFHGGVVGCALAVFIYTKVTKVSFMLIADLVTTAIPIGYFWGRMGNFFNAELYGRVTASGLGMLFPGAQLVPTTEPWAREIADKLQIEYVIGDYINLPRFPSQLFEAFFEGIVLFVLLWFFVRRCKIKHGWANGVCFAAFLIGYGLFRFFIEYLRQPDRDIGYVLEWGGGGDIAIFTSPLNISKGQIYCLLMILAGVIMIVTVELAQRHRLKKELEERRRLEAMGVKDGKSGKTHSPKKGNRKRRH